MSIEGENKMPLCKFCDENHLELRHETKRVTLKGIEVDYDHKFFYCPDLEEEFEEGDLIDENLNAARNAYRKKVGLLTSDEIKAIRDRFSLSQKDLAVLLEMGEVSITRIETKLIQDKTTDDTIRRLVEDPVFLLNKLEKAKEKLGKKYSIIKSKINLSEELIVYNKRIISVYYNELEKSKEFIGNIELSYEKIENMIIFFLSKCEKVYKTKLNKLLWYSDFLNYKETNLSISGLAYTHRPFGAVPVAIDEILSVLPDINIEEKENEEAEYTYFEISTTKEFNASCFNTAELLSLEKIAKEFKTIGNRKISEKMHEEKAYIETKDKQHINYEFAKYLKIN